MAKLNKKLNIPHNVKERFRHQHLQRVLEHVASHIPQLPCEKKDTKAKKLRHIVLYLRYLINKKLQLKKPTQIRKCLCVPKIVDKTQITKVNAECSKAQPVMKTDSRKPQIVFLKKFSPTSNEKDLEPDLSTKSVKVHCDEKKSTKCKLSLEEDSVGVSFKDNPCSSDLCISHQENGITSVYNPSKDIDHDYNVPLSLKLSSHSIIKKKKPLNKALSRPWEENVLNFAPIGNSLPGNICSTQKIKSETFKTVKDCMFANNDRNIYPLVQGPLYASQEHSFVELNEKSDFSVQDPSVDSDKRQRAYKVENYSKLKLISETNFGNNTSGKIPPISTFIPKRENATDYGDHTTKDNFLNSLESKQLSGIPIQSCDNLTNVFDIHREVNFLTNPISFSQNRDNFPLDFFSSSESAAITSSSEWISSGETGFTETSVPDSPDIEARSSLKGLTVPILNEGSCDNDSCTTQNSCDMYKDPHETCCDIEQYMNFNQKNNIPVSFSTSCGLPISVINAPLLSLHNGKCIDFPTYASSHNISGQGTYQNIVDPRFVIHNDMQNFHPIPTDYFHVSQNNRGENCNQAADAGIFIKQEDFSVPHYDCMLDSYETIQDTEGFGNSKFNEENVCRDLFDGKIRHKDFGTSLLAEEISYSLNNIDTADWHEGNYFDS